MHLKPLLPYSKPKRLPRTKTVTIAIAIQADDGVVVATDSEESGGYLKSGATKIIHVFGETTLGDKPSPPKGACLISGAGSSVYVDSLMHELANVFLADNQRIAAPLQQAFEDCIVQFHNDHIITFASFPREERPQVDMLIAYWRNHNHGFFISDKSVVVRKMLHATVGCGSIFADILLDRLWRRATTKEIEILAAYVVFMTKESIEGCGKYTQLATLHHSKIIQGESGAILMPPEYLISHVPLAILDEWESQFRTNWAKAEQDALWNLIAQSTAQTSEPKP
jgi:hypothetical protein